MDYEETFAPIEKLTTILTLIAIASTRQWCISQLDVNNVFLNENLQEEVYMEPLPSVSHDSGYVCSRRNYIVSNKHLVLGLRNFVTLQIIH